MAEKFVLYGLSALCIVMAATLLIYRTRLISGLSDKQIEAIFGKVGATEVDLNIFAKSLVKMKSHYPSLIFLVPAIALAYWASQMTLAKTAWDIKGVFVPENGAAVQPDWRNGVLAIFPTDFESELGANGEFRIRLSIPEGETFEDYIQFVEYSGKQYWTRFSPAEELAKYEQQGSEASLLTQKQPNARYYSKVPVRSLPGETVEGAVPR